MRLVYLLIGLIIGYWIGELITLTVMVLCKESSFKELMLKIIKMRNDLRKGGK